MNKLMSTTQCNSEFLPQTFFCYVNITWVGLLEVIANILLT